MDLVSVGIILGCLKRQRRQPNKWEETEEDGKSRIERDKLLKSMMLAADLESLLRPTLTFC
jgi:hypothetical protein